MTPSRADGGAASEFLDSQRGHGAGHPSSGQLAVLRGGARAIDDEPDTADPSTNGRAHRCGLAHVEDLAALDVGGEPPHDIEAELGVLGSMLLFDEATHPGDDMRREAVLASVEPADFYRTPHGDVFRAMRELLQEKGALDVLLLREELHRRGALEAVGGTGFLSRIVASVPSAANAEHYAQIVREAARRRRIAGAAKEVQLAELAGDAAQRSRAHEEFARILDASSVADEGLHLTLPQLFAADLPKRRILVEDVLDRTHVAIVYGPSGAGKTWACMALALAAALGHGEWFGRSIAARQVVLYVFGEDTPQRARDRLEKLCASANVTPDVEGLHLAWPPANARNLASPSGQRWLNRKIRATGAELVFIDNLTALVGIDKKDDEAVAAFYRDLHALRDEHDCTFVLLAHVRKGGGDATSRAGTSSADALFGSHVWRSLADVLFMLDEDTDRERRWIVCRHTKARDVEAIPPRFFELSGESGRFEFRGDVGAAKKRTPTGAAVQVVTDTKLFEVLTRLGDWTTTGRWSDAVPMPESTLKSRLARFVEDGQIERKPGPRNSFLYRVAQANETNDGRSSGGRA